MKSKLLSIILALVVVGLLTYHYGPDIIRNFNTAYAVGDLTVNWGVGVGDVGPIFTVSNMAPGQSQSRTVTVANGASLPRPVGIRGVRNTETGNIATVMDIVITKDGAPIYGTGSATGAKTVGQFFTDSTLPNFIALSTLTPSETEQYTITVSFKPEAGNEFQNRNLNFNFIMGMNIDTPVACSGINLNGETIYGTAGNDRLRGTNKNDLIYALEGNDQVDGGNGNDCIVDGSGNGTLNGGNGDDVIASGEGNVTIDGGNGTDVLFAGAGNDTVTGGNGDDDIHGEAGLDQLEGDNGDDEILGGEGNDRMIGGLGNDVLNGEAGTDSADGKLGRDTCLAETKLACEL